VNHLTHSTVNSWTCTEV